VGDRKAYSRLAELAETSDPALRSGAAWAMGEIGDPEFGDTLEKLVQDADVKVSDMARKSQKKLRGPDPIVLPQAAGTPAGQSSPMEDSMEDSTASVKVGARSWLSGTGRVPT
jgi:hypothetical protein